MVLGISAVVARAAGRPSASGMVSHTVLPRLSYRL